MKRAVLVLAVVVGLVLEASSPAQAQAAGASSVTPWIELELDAIAVHRLNPPRASRALAHVSRAMYLAALAGGSRDDDAVSGAASTVLRYFHPEEAARINALAGELANPHSAAFRRGSLIGQLLVARAENDGADVTWTGSPPIGPGSWVPTPPA
jgi:hypothetical protein